jgi:hypothetical protein
MVTAGMSFQRLVDLLTSLFQYRFQDEALRTTLETHTKRISELEQTRKALMHSSWLLESANINEATRLKITASRKKGLSYFREVLTAAELDQVADAFRGALADFWQFHSPAHRGPAITAGGS